ncbi:MAG: NAD(+) synthase [Planctomycetales bacterium]
MLPPSQSWPFIPVALHEPSRHVSHQPMMPPQTPPSGAAGLLHINPQQETDRIVEFLREQVGVHLKRKGVVLGLSGSVESSLCAALCVRAFGNKRVLGLLMPELDTPHEEEGLARDLAAQLGIAAQLEDISPILSGAGCYVRRDQALRAVLPEFGPGYRLLFSSAKWLTQQANRRVEFLVEKPDGSTIPLQLTRSSYESLVAASHFKQRTRRMIEYFYADQLHYAVVGTSNLPQYDQGDFVKNGDGAADIKPIAHLYKTQVDQLAAHLDLPSAIRSRPQGGRTLVYLAEGEPALLSVSDRELDLCLYALNHGMPHTELSEHLGFTPEQTDILLQDVLSRRAEAAYLHSGPMLISNT